MSMYESKEEFIQFLEKTFIPKLRKLGFVFTVATLEEAVYWLREEEE